jgi:hypothetical protein
MRILDWIIPVLCVPNLSALALPTKSQHSRLLSLPSALMLRDVLHRRSKPEYSSTPLVSETTASKSTQIDSGDGRIIATTLLCAAAPSLRLWADQNSPRGARFAFTLPTKIEGSE